MKNAPPKALPRFTPAQKRLIRNTVEEEMKALLGIGSMEFLRTKASFEELRALTIRMGELEASLTTIRDYINQTVKALR